MSISIFCALGLVIITYTPKGYSLNILGVFPVPEQSHSDPAFHLMRELAARGHDVTFLSSFQRQKESVKNLKHISLEGFSALLKNKSGFSQRDQSLFEAIQRFYTLSNALANSTYSSDEVQQLMKSHAKFDVIILDEFTSASLMGLSHYFQAPLVLFSTGSTILNTNLFSNPVSSFNVPNPHTSLSSSMDLFGRLHNAFSEILDLLYRHLIYYPKENELLHQYLPDAPQLSDILNNVSLILLNSHSSIDNPLYLPPNMIEIGGFHVGNPKPLPADVKKLLDSAVNGVVYSDIPIEKTEGLLNVFSRIDKNVLWKCDTQDVNDPPKNVVVKRWFPQQDVIAHENVIAFVSQGDQIGIIEAVHHGIPMVGIPVTNEQKRNVANAVQKGFAVGLPYSELTENNLYNALKKVLEDPRYSLNVKARSHLLRNRPIKPLDTAVYWVEYVGRHGKCSHFKSPLRDLAWYERSMLGIIIVLTIITIILFLIFYYIIKKIINPHPHTQNKEFREKKE